MLQAAVTKPVNKNLFLMFTASYGFHTFFCAIAWYKRHRYIQRALCVKVECSSNRNICRLASH